MALTIISMPKQPNRPGVQQGLVTDREARQVARLAGLGYRLSGLSGTLQLPAGVRLRTAGDQTADTERRSARKRDRSGPVYVVGIGDQKFDEPVLHRKWKKSKAGRKQQ